MNLSRMCIAVACLSLAAVNVQGELMPLDSEAFAHRYEATDIPGLPEETTDYTVGNAENSHASVSGGILNYDTTIVPEANGTLWWNTETWGASSDDTIGWTVEVRLRIIESSGILPTDPTTPSSAFFISAGDGDDWGALFINTSEITYGDQSSDSFETIPTADNTDGFHIFRLAKEANSDVVQIYRDGMRIGTDIPTPTTRVFNRLQWGDGSSLAIGVVDVDYFRWDTTGAFAPLPEPITAMILVGAAAPWALSRRR